MRYLIYISFLLMVLSCEEEALDDPRDIYVGKYLGISIYEDQQEGIKDTTEVVLFINKYDLDTVPLLELILPEADQNYYYWIVEEKIDIYGDRYRKPILEIRNDSLFINWYLAAPRSMKYIAVKQSN